MKTPISIQERVTAICQLCGWIGIPIFRAKGRIYCLILVFCLVLQAGLAAGGTPVVVQTRKLIASDAASFDAANTVGIDETGDLVIIGDGQRVRGTAYLHERNVGGANAWGERKKFVAPDSFDFDRFGRSPQISGDILAINNRPGGNNARTTGSVYLYDRHLGGKDNWGFVKKLSGSGDDQFANTHHLKGQILAVGAPWDDEAGADAGACYIFERHQGGSNQWGQVSKILSPDAEPGEEFGFWPQVEGTTLAVAANWDFDGDISSVSAYIFERDQANMTNWMFIRKVRPAITGVYDVGNTLGPTIELNGDVLVIGSEWDDTQGQNAGAALIYYRNQGGSNSWGQAQKIVPLEGQAGDRFGTRLAIYGDMLAVSAFGEFSFGLRRPGAVYLFQRNAGGLDQWSQVARIIPSDAYVDDEAFGCCRIDFKNGLLAVPAWLDDANGTDTGSVYLFQIFEPPSLSIENNEAQVHISWPAIPGINFQLYGSQGIMPVGWTAVNGATNSPATIPIQDSSQFFQLRMLAP